jgi:hypothetical protein
MSRRRPRTLIIVALIMHVPVATWVIGRPSAQSFDNDDAALYTLALQDSRSNGRVAPTDPLVLQRQTINPRTIYFDLPSDVVRQAFLDPAIRLAYAGSDTVARFLQMEGEEEIRAIADTADVRFIERKELDRLKGQGPDGWVRFQKRLGSGVRLIRLSRIARNDEGTVALLYISYSCGPLCGESHFVLFRRESGFWRVERIDLFSQS